MSCLPPCRSEWLAHSRSRRSAQGYPSRPITLVVPFAAGGSPDIIARALGEELGAALGQNVVVENRGGAGGNIAAMHVIEQPADGHTLFLGTSGNMATNKVLYRQLKFDPERDFIPISIAYASCNVLIVPAASPIQSIPDLIAEAKRRPGALSFGSPGVGTAGHLIGEFFKSRAGVEMVHVPYRGQTLVINDLLGGHLSMLVRGGRDRDPGGAVGADARARHHLPATLAADPERADLRRGRRAGLRDRGAGAGRDPRADARADRRAAQPGDREDHPGAEALEPDHRHGPDRQELDLRAGAGNARRRDRALAHGGGCGKNPAARLRLS